MAAENAPVENGQGTETPGDAGEGFDYRDGYTKLRPEFTRVTQENAERGQRLSEYEQLFDALHDPDPEIQQQAFDLLGLELGGGSPGSAPADDGFVDPLEQEVERLRDVVGSLESSAREQEAQRESARIEQLRDDYIGEAIGFIEQSLTEQEGKKFSFTQREEQVLGNLAIAMEDSEGVPDVKGAYDVLYGDEGFLEVNRGRWIDTKTGAARPPLGTTAPARQELKTKGDRVAYIDQRMYDLENQQ